MSEVVSTLTNHLWQSTLFAALVVAAAFALRRNYAKTRYWLWLAASVKFLIPFSLLVSLGSRVEIPVAKPVMTAVAVEQINTSFAPVPVVSSRPGPAPWWPATVGMVWVAGVVVLLTRWLRRWLTMHAAVRQSTPMPIAAPIPVLSSRTTIEPGVFGILSPVLILPEGITNKLSAEELDAILTHEICHVERRDNLTATLQMLIEALFWFHPLVWWIGARLIEERERACDEAVLSEGSKPHIYAQGILNVCKFYLESPLPCASGVTGADLKKRIEEIMTKRISNRLTFARKLLLTAAGIAAVSAPIMIGILNAQAPSGGPAFEVASVKPSDPDARRVGSQFTAGGGINVTNMSLKGLIATAYNVPCGKGCNAVILGGPKWVDSQHFDIVAKGPQSGEDAAFDPMKLTEAQRNPFQERIRLRLQALLAERFQLVVRRETKEMPVYALTVAKSGLKIKPSTTASEGGTMRGERGHMIAENVPLQWLVSSLAAQLGRPVLDRTGLSGRFDFTFTYAMETRAAVNTGPGEKGDGPGGADPSGPSIFTAVQEQLGLKLESAKGPVEFLVIDRAEQPTAN